MKRVIIILLIAVSIYCQKSVINEGFESFTFPPEGWVSVDADNDSFNWEFYDIANASHSGEYCAASFSVDYNTGYTPLNPENYLITPQIDATEGTIVDFWAATRSATYFDEHLEVRISTGSTNPEDFTDTVFEFDFTNDNSWQNFSVDLSQYSGEQIYIGFVHTNSTDMFAVLLDDVVVISEDISYPEVTEISNLDSFYDEDLHFNFTVQEQSGIEEISGFYKFDGSDEVFELTISEAKDSYQYNSMIPSQLEPKDGVIYFTLTDNLGNSGNSPEYPFSLRDYNMSLDEGFESGVFPPAGWSTLDNDGDTKIWEEYELTVYVHSGNYCAASFSSDYENGQAPLQPDNYLISPKLYIHNVSDLEFYIDTQSDTYFAEHFELKLALTDKPQAELTADDFGITLYEKTFTETELDWIKVELDLSEYQDNVAYLAFVHVSDEHNFAVKLDDIKLFQTSDIEELVAEEITLLKAYPNPFNPIANLNVSIVNEGDYQFKVFNSKGELVYSRELSLLKGENSFNFDAQNLTSGAYFGKLIGSGSQVISSTKLVLLK